MISNDIKLIPRHLDMADTEPRFLHSNRTQWTENRLRSRPKAFCGPLRPGISGIRSRPPRGVRFPAFLDGGELYCPAPGGGGLGRAPYPAHGVGRGGGRAGTAVAAAARAERGFHRPPSIGPSSPPLLRSALVQRWAAGAGQRMTARQGPR